MELLFDISLLFTGDASMVSINVRSIQPSDENMALADVNVEYYYHDFLKPSKVNPLHVVFSLRGVLARKENPLNVIV
jgi:hypothetical protein